jgi:hypothetical protein
MGSFGAGGAARLAAAAANKRLHHRQARGLADDASSAPRRSHPSRPPPAAAAAAPLMTERSAQSRLAARTAAGAAGAGGTAARGGGASPASSSPCRMSSSIERRPSNCRVHGRREWEWLGGKFGTGKGVRQARCAGALRGRARTVADGGDSAPAPRRRAGAASGVVLAGAGVAWRVC